MTASSPTITTCKGTIRGKRLIDEPDFQADAYLGVPYARPPLGELRFKKPLPSLEWAGTRECVHHPAKCVQQLSELLSQNDKDWPASEDCLYLNVFSPGDYPANNKRPVLVFIHGGGFARGSIRAYGDRAICDGLVRQGLVVVMIQYRLGTCPGNFGLWDQIAALRWIQANIEQFGGDKDNVTICGQSAGGACADLLSLSPHANGCAHFLPISQFHGRPRPPLREGGLFHRTILMSGNARAPWSHRPSTAESCRQYSETVLGVKADSNDELIAQLRLLPSAVLESRLLATTARFEFHPVIDGDLLPAPIEQLIVHAKALPVMAGATTLEGGLHLPDKDLTDAHLKKAVTALLRKDDCDESIEALSAKYKEVALRKQPEHAVWRAMAEVNSDLVFNLPTVQTLQERIRRGIPPYFYVFDYYNKACIGPLAQNSPCADTPHCSELAYLFNDGVVAPFAFSEDDEQVAHLVMRAFANFAKSGNPNDDGSCPWQPCDVLLPTRHMVLGTQPRMQQQFKKGRCERVIGLMK
ncbi:hypothetical protein PRIPAC_73867 [Pristionchus pacificus]|uniref:Carboxylic ester hydrolase n=1 Tax=Pristionchus pacificus TaxID=54126 RepID=A0A2A6C174_PRIPA|nr:hypothetical protein PRIPAC_73867 [Pristionchus pacificus]|eukprot:PDM71859.1 hydrolase [Pristionchus pacificus]